MKRLMYEYQCDCCNCNIKSYYEFEDDYDATNEEKYTQKNICGICGGNVIVKEPIELK